MHYNVKTGLQEHNRLMQNRQKKKLYAAGPFKDKLTYATTNIQQGGEWWHFCYFLDGTIENLSSSRVNLKSK